MNGRINKVMMVARTMRIIQGIMEQHWYPEWSDKERWAAQLALNNVLDVLDEYWE